MNQILNDFNNKKRNIKSILNKSKNQNNNVDTRNETNNIIQVSQLENTPTKSPLLSNNRKIKQYKLQFFISIIIFIIALSLLISNVYSYEQKENVSKALLNSISITKLYSNSENYTTSDSKSDSDISKNINNVVQEDPFVIGILQIDKINVNYPILSKTSRELLKVSLCRCAGPMPNEKGNLCIAGHNLVDYKLFSRLNEININDIVKIYDLKGNMNEYKIYKKYEVEPTDLSCLSQNTDGNTVITLLTCNNVNGKRLIVVGQII